MSKKRKIFVITVALAAIVILAVNILVFTGVVNRIVRENLEKILSASVKGKCHIGEFNGTLNYFTLENVEITSASIDAKIKKGEMGIGLTGLLFKKIIINKISLDGIDIKLKKTANNDSIAVNKPFYYKMNIEKMPYSLEIVNLQCNAASFSYDTFELTDINMIASFTLNSKRGFLYYKLTGAKYKDILNMRESEGELGFDKDSLFHRGVINSNIISVSDTLVIIKDTVYIKNIAVNSTISNMSYMKHSYTLKSDAVLKGVISNSYRDFECNLNIQDISCDDYAFSKISASADMRGDTIYLKGIESADSLFEFSVNGIVELAEKADIELVIMLKGVSLDRFMPGKNIAENLIYGRAVVKSDGMKTFSVLFDSVYGYYGSQNALNLKGSLTYVDSNIMASGVKIGIMDGTITMDGSFGKKDGALKIELNNLPLEILSSLKNDTKVSGYVKGSVTLKGSIERYSGLYDLEITNAIYSDNSFEYAAISGNWNGKKNVLNRLLLKGSLVNGILFSHKVSIIYLEALKDGKDIYADIDGVSDILTVGLTGKLITDDYYKSIKGSIERFDIKTDMDEFSITGETKIEISEDKYKIDGFCMKGEKGGAEISFSYDKKYLDFNIDIEDKNLDVIKYFTKAPVYGDLKFTASGKGHIDSIDMKLNANLNGFKFEGIEIDSLHANCDLSEKHFNINYLNIYNEGKLSYIYGDIAVKSFKEISLSDLNLTAHLENIDEKIFAPLERIFTIKTKNGISADGIILGTLANPLLYCDIFVDSTDINIVSLGTTIYKAVGKARIDGETGVIEYLKGKSEKGDVLLTGNVEKSKYKLKEYYFKVMGDGVHSTGIDYVDVFANCSLDIRGGVKWVDLQGDIYVSEGVSNFPFIVSGSEGGSSSESSSETNINLLLHGDNNIWLKNSFVDIELQGDILFKKNKQKINLSGKAYVKRGYYFYLDKKFKVIEGTFELIETNKIVEPVVNISSSTKIQYIDGIEKKNVEIFLKASGSAYKPTISLYSEPAMGIENIISILSFNSTVSSLSNLEEISKGVPEKALQIYLRNKYLNVISSSIGVDQLDIQTDLLGDTKSAKLSVGKYIGKNIYVSYTHDIFTFSNDVFRFEYNFLTNTDFVTERDEQGSYNAGIQFKYRF